jgi:hypothetical protein
MSLDAPELAVDFLSRLNVEQCVEALEGLAAREPQLAVRVDGRYFEIDVSRRWSARLWLLRFEGELVPMGGGTRLQGRIVPNLWLDRVIAVCVIATMGLAGFNMARISRAMPETLTTYLIFMGLLAALLIGAGAFYMWYRSDLRAQMQALLQQLEDTLFGPPPDDAVR